MLLVGHAVWRGLYPFGVRLHHTADLQREDVSTREMALDADWPSMDKVESKLLEVSEKIRQRRDEWNRVQAQLLALKKQGLTYAGTTWKNGKYLYLVYPSKNGEPRKRVYVGHGEEKVREALAGIERGEQYLKLEERAEWLQRQSQLAGYHCMNLLDYLGDGVQFVPGHR